MIFPVSTVFYCHDVKNTKKKITIDFRRGGGLSGKFGVYRENLRNNSMYHIYYVGSKQSLPKKYHRMTDQLVYKLFYGE